eukprot:6200019-Pleurochrysis_carterae.AAC.1
MSGRPALAAVPTRGAAPTRGLEHACAGADACVPEATGSPVWGDEATAAASRRSCFICCNISCIP